MHQQQHQQQENSQPDIYKDVVVIGNGPSGICLSYLLDGNWPSYTGESHPCDEMLTARLRYNYGKSNCMGCRSSREILEGLSAGLEGRNCRPLSLLMDQLQHPGLDAGFDLPSLVRWSSSCDEHGRSRHRRVEHVVLGKGPPGGAWNSLDPDVLTISLSRWMSLPGLDLRQWEASLGDEERRRLKLGATTARNYDSRRRVPIGLVAAYYRDYVVKQCLEKYFRCDTVVTSVRPTQEPSGEGWLVRGYECETGRTFQYRCRKVVLASGATDLSNRLGVSGEETYNWVTHDLKSFEQKLDQLRKNLEFAEQYEQRRQRQRRKPRREPVLVVGSGLSAADAIMAARDQGVPVLHIFRNTSKTERHDSLNNNDNDDDNNNNNNNNNSSTSRSLEKLKWLPASVYPEYHKVYEMMADREQSYPLYRALPDYVVVEFSIGADKCARTKTRKVTLCAPQGRLVSYRVSQAAVLIGSKPDLSYLQNNGIGLGKVPDKPVDSRSNQLDVDVFSSRVKRAPRKGLYAVGPLVGDNFVRFILGGAFAVLVDVLNDSEQ